MRFYSQTFLEKVVIYSKKALIFLCFFTGLLQQLIQAARDQAEIFTPDAAFDALQNGKKKLEKKRYHSRRFGAYTISRFGEFVYNFKQLMYFSKEIHPYVSFSMEYHYIRVRSTYQDQHFDTK